MKNQLPLVSFCIVTFNQENFIEECIKSVLQLDYENLEIIISDDCSTDGTFGKIEKTILRFNSKHTIVLNRNAVNEGIGAHCSKLYNKFCNGQYIVNLGGDDVVESDYISFVIDRFKSDLSLKLIDVSGKIINKDSIIKSDIELPFDEKIYNLTDYIMLKPLSTFAPGRTFTKDLINNYDEISPNCPTEDSVLVLRGLLEGNIARINKKCILYRQHDSNVSSAAGMRTIDHGSIVAQFRKDVAAAYANRKISANTLSVLNSKLKLDLLFRNNISKSTLFRLISNMSHKILYKLNLYNNYSGK